jgi:hypothetical protein
MGRNQPEKPWIKGAQKMMNSYFSYLSYLFSSKSLYERNIEKFLYFPSDK